MNVATIIFFIVIGLGFSAYLYFTAKKVREEDERFRIPSANEIRIVNNDEEHEISRGDFYIRDTRMDLNPFERFDVYRIEDVRENVTGEKWVRYSVPGFTCNYDQNLREITAPLKTFLPGKVRVEKIATDIK